jgi:hypothetical protein
MAGFPLRPNRTAYGPDPQNRRPVRNPKQELSADIGKLMMWQLAGAGLVVPMAWLYCTVAGGVLTLVSFAESFDPVGTIPPAVVRTSQGLYTVAYPSTAPDENGTTTAVSLTFGLVIPQSSASRFGIPERVDAQHFTLRIRDDAGAVQDSNFAALFW